MNLKAVAALLIAALGLGLYIGKTYYSVTKTVEVEREVVRTDVVTVERVVERKDGTKETIKTTTDKSVAKKDSSNTVVSTPAPVPDWHISASATTDFKNLQPVYGLQVEKRLLGPFSLGVRADTNKTVGLVVGFEF